MWVYLLLALVVVLVGAMIWRQQQERLRQQQEREDRRARTDELLARVLLGEEPGQGRRTAGGRPPPVRGRAMPSPVERMVNPTTTGGQKIDVDILLGDEPESVAERARQQLSRPTNLAPDTGSSSAAGGASTVSSASPLSLSDGQLDVPLDALVVAWFEARGYVGRPAPESARPISALLTHREDRDRSYAFYFERGRLHAQRAAGLLEQARQLGMNKLLVAAEHGADPAVGSSRLRDVQVMDWVAIDREMKKLDFRVAAKIIAIARGSADRNAGH